MSQFVTIIFPDGRCDEIGEISRWSIDNNGFLNLYKDRNCVYVAAPGWSRVLWGKIPK